MADVIIIFDVVTLAITVQCVSIHCYEGRIGLVLISCLLPEVLHLLEDEVPLWSLHASQPPSSVRNLDRPEESARRSNGYEIPMRMSHEANTFTFWRSTTVEGSSPAI